MSLWWHLYTYYILILCTSFLLLLVPLSFPIVLLLFWGHMYAINCHLPPLDLLQCPLPVKAMGEPLVAITFLLLMPTHWQNNKRKS